MSTTTLIITGITFLLFITIYILSVSGKKKKANMLLGNLSRLSGVNLTTLTQYEIWNNSVIALDDSGAVLYFIRNSSDDQTFQKVLLPEIKRCWVNEVSRAVSINGSSIKVVEKVELKMENKGKSKPDTIIEFYNQDSGRLDLSGELQLAEKWCKLLNDTIPSISNQ
ncbi:MAG: hypothetical protein ACM3O8_09585 [Methylococcaceae bacterium]|nr:hypothetical protein [Prolixibacteraceae bacterium]